MKRPLRAALCVPAIAALLTVMTACDDDQTGTPGADGALPASASATPELAPALPSPAPATTSAPTPTPTPTPTPPIATPVADPAPAPTSSSTPSASASTEPPTHVPEPRIDRVITGKLVLSTPGEVVSNVRVEGNVEVHAPNVTLRDSVVVGRENPDTFAGLVSTKKAMQNFTLENVIIHEQTPSMYNVAGIVGSDFTARGVEVIGQVDSVTIIGDDVTIDSSVLRDTVEYFDHPQSPDNGRTHSDNVQILQGDNITVRNTRASGSQNFALLAAPEHGSVNGLVVDGNHFDDGYCVTKFTPYGGTYPQSAVVTNNVFGSGASSNPSCRIVVVDGFVGHFENNRDETGRQVPITPTDH